MNEGFYMHIGILGYKRSTFDEYKIEKADVNII